jgi:hypothetical protein
VEYIHVLPGLFLFVGIIQIGGIQIMAKGNPLAYKNAKNSPVIGDNGVAPISKNENEALILNALDVFHSTPPDLDDPEAVAQAIDKYFKSCIDRGVRPGNMGLYGVLGLSRQDVNNAINGYSKRLGSATIDTIKKACTAMSTYRESLGSSGKLNPVTLIFWQKNFDGLKDVQDVVVTPNSNVEPEMSIEQIEQDIPIDID